VYSKNADRIKHNIVNRMASQKQSRTSFTIAELQNFTPKTVCILPKSDQAMERTQSGMLTSNAIAKIIKNLKDTKNIPSMTLTPETYDASMKVFMRNVKLEYNEYNDAYAFTLQQVFSNIRNGYTSSTSDVQSTVKIYLGLASSFNGKLNDSIQIMKGISDDMVASSDKMDQELKEFNAKLMKDKERLEYQSNIIKSNDAGAKIHKEMMKYTEEKARYTDNLLSLYSFLNVVALGLLVYIYRAAE